MKQYRCSECGTYWSNLNQKQCPNCGNIYKVMTEPARIPPREEYGTAITSISLSWGDAFAIGFKFCVVLAVFQAAFLFVAYLLWGS